MDRPSFPFYSDAWLSDTALRACSSAARGLWIDLIAHMHQGTPYGHLRLSRGDGKFYVPNEKEIARMTGNSVAQVRRWLTELEDKSVAKRDQKGVIFSKKMVQDHAKREEWAKRQKRHRDRGKSNNINSDSPNVTRDTLRDVTRDVTPESHPIPSPSPIPSSTPGVEESEISTDRRADAVWWDSEQDQLLCEPAFLDDFHERYDEDTSPQWVDERLTYHNGWLSEHRSRLRELVSAGGLAEWLRNRLREDHAREISRPRTADELTARAARTRRRP